MSDAQHDPLRRVYRDKKGFALIGLLVVVGIIMVLAAVVVPRRLPGSPAAVIKGLPVQNGTPPKGLSRP